MSKETVVDLEVLRQRIQEIVIEELELDPAEFSGSGHFVDDYEADSLSLITVVARIEKELGIVVPKTELPNMSSLDSTVTVVAAHAGEESQRA